MNSFQKTIVITYLSYACFGKEMEGHLSCQLWRNIFDPGHNVFMEDLLATRDGGGPLHCGTLISGHGDEGHNS